MRGQRARRSRAAWSSGRSWLEAGDGSRRGAGALARLYMPRPPSARASSRLSLTHTHAQSSTRRSMQRLRARCLRRQGCARVSRAWWRCAVRWARMSRKRTTCSFCAYYGPSPSQVPRAARWRRRLSRHAKRSSRARVGCQRRSFSRAVRALRTVATLPRCAMPVAARRRCLPVPSITSSPNAQALRARTCRGAHSATCKLLLTRATPRDCIPTGAVAEALPRRVEVCERDTAVPAR